MNPEELKNTVEAAIYAADKPMTVDKLLAIFPEEHRPERDEIKAALEELETDYAERGIELKQVASGYRFQVRENYTSRIQGMWEEKPAKYSRAVLETLALIAYRQPITRGEIEEVRGVSVSSHIIKSLLEREWIRVVGHRDVAGKPALFATTKHFLDYFNLASMEDLPPLSALRDLDEIGRELDLNEGAAAEELQEMAAEEMAGEEGAEVIIPEAANEDTHLAVAASRDEEAGAAAGGDRIEDLAQELMAALEAEAKADQAAEALEAELSDMQRSLTQSVSGDDVEEEEGGESPPAPAESGEQMSAGAAEAEGQEVSGDETDEHTHDEETPPA